MTFGKMLSERLKETSDKVMSKTDLKAYFHTPIVGIVSAGIALTSSTVTLIDRELHVILWYILVTTVPVGLSALISVIWHWKLEGKFIAKAIAGWRLHTFQNLREEEANFSLPPPETYLVVAAAGVAGSFVTLSGQDWWERTAVGALVGAVIAMAMVLAKSDVGPTILRGRTMMQSEVDYQQMLDRKRVIQTNVVHKQKYKCGSCYETISKAKAKYAIINPEGLSTGPILERSVAAFCRKCSFERATTDWQKDTKTRGRTPNSRPSKPSRKNSAQRPR